MVAWGQAAKTYKNKILILLKRALCLMLFSDYISHAVPYFVSSSFLPLDLVYFKSVAALLHDISNSLTHLLAYLTCLLPNLIFIHIIQGHLQEVIFKLNTQD